MVKDREIMQDAVSTELHFLRHYSWLLISGTVLVPNKPSLCKRVPLYQVYLNLIARARFGEMNIAPLNNKVCIQCLPAY